MRISKRERRMKRILTETLIEAAAPEVNSLREAVEALSVVMETGLDNQNKMISALINSQSRVMAATTKLFESASELFAKEKEAVERHIQLSQEAVKPTEFDDRF